MRILFRCAVTAILALGVTQFYNPQLAAAADLALKAAPSSVGSCSEIVFACENGRHYPLCPIAVSVAGEVVTASLQVGHHGGTHVRLVPMGVGYRYAGRGIWVDGLRENAVMNFGKHHSVACTVTTP